MAADEKGGAQHQPKGTSPVLIVAIGCEQSGGDRD
jgi:hypothetical protein